jgi:Fe-S cluster assembly scaffold protein SufB
MIHYNLRNNAQCSGGFTDLFILGSFRRWDATTKSWLSDFSADVSGVSSGSASTAQKFNLIQLTETTPAVSTGTQAAVPRFIVGYPLCAAVIKYAIADGATNAKLDVGVAASVTANTSLIAGTAGDLEQKDLVILPAAAAVPLAPNTVSQYLTATITSASGNVSTMTAATGNPANVGIDIWIYACLLPYREWIQNRDA